MILVPVAQLSSTLGAFLKFLLNTAHFSPFPPWLTGQQHMICLHAPSGQKAFPLLHPARHPLLPVTFSMNHNHTAQDKQTWRDSKLKVTIVRTPFLNPPRGKLAVYFLSLVLSVTFKKQIRKDNTTDSSVLNNLESWTCRSSRRPLSPCRLTHYNLADFAAAYLTYISKPITWKWKAQCSFTPKGFSPLGYRILEMIVSKGYPPLSTLNV